MKNLYSPWRTDYIASFDKHKNKPACVFCEVSTGKKDAEALIIHRGKHCFVILNRYPYNAGHLMIVPYRHLKLAARLTTDEQREMMELFLKSVQILEQTLAPHGFNMGMNLGRTAGAGIDKHIHMHVVPRWNGDTNFMPTVAETKVVSQSVTALQKVLAGKFKKL